MEFQYKIINFPFKWICKVHDMRRKNYRLKIVLFLTCIIVFYIINWSFPGGSESKESACNAGDLGLIPAGDPWRRKWQYTPLFLSGKFHGQKSLVGYNPWGGKITSWFTCDWISLLTNTFAFFFFFLTHSLLFEVQCILTAELFKILRNDSARSISANLENSSVSTGLGKISFHSSSKEGQCQEYSNYHTFVLISRASEVMPNILQARLQQYLNWGLPDVQAGFRKGRETRDQIINIGWIMQKAREFQKIIYFCFVDYTSILTSILTILLPLTMWITTNYENS